MKKKYYTIFYSFLFLLSSLFFVACKDDYYYNDKTPDASVVGESIYDWLNNDGHFTYYLKIVQSVQDAGTDYSEVLKVTGTKTVFVADDAAFEAFFTNNPYGIRKFEDFTTAQKRAIFFSCMLNDAYLVEMLSSTPGGGDSKPNEGQALRRTTSWSVLDSIPFESGDRLPLSPYWDQYREKGIHLMKDNSQWMMVHFLEPQMRIQGITAEDFRYLTKTKENPEGMDWDSNAAYIFDTKIVRKDITCKNGYINILEKVFLPVSNMAEYIRNNKETQIFARLLDRFCAPYYDAASTSAYRQLYPNFSERIYNKRFFTAANSYFPTADGLSTNDSKNKVDALLDFDPGKNNYAPEAQQTQLDMGAFFVPTDAAMNEYFNNGGGKFLKERYHEWDSIPNSVVIKLINNLMRPSFLQTTPRRFSGLTNSMGSSMNVKKQDLKYTAICTNGAVYVVDKVYSPSDYAAVTAPVTVSEATRIMDWAINDQKFTLYLLSLENKFSLLVPTDSVFNNYISPASVRASVPERWKFYMKNNSVTATRYNTAGDSIGTVSSGLVANALLDIIDNHIVVGDIEDGKKYYKTKGGSTIRIAGQGVGMKTESGGNIEDGETVSVIDRHVQENGKTFFVDKVIRTPMQSVYQILENEPEFSTFFSLCRDVQDIRIDKTIYGGFIFRTDSKYPGIKPNVASFETFHYTVYVPTNAAMAAAHQAGRYKTPAEIEAIYDELTKAVEMQKLYDFLRYHFQDNSIYIGGEAYTNKWFETATLDESGKKFRRLWVTNSDSGISIQTKENGGIAANVITSGSLYNIMARDYKFDSTKASASRPEDFTIYTSSFAVIHQINSVLDFQ